MKVTFTMWFRKAKGILLHSSMLLYCLASLSVYADDAPIITAARVTNAIPGTMSVPIPITVTNFNNIGQFTLTMKFDTTKVRYVSATTNASLPGMTVTYTSPSGNTQGKLVFAWTGATNVSLSDGSSLANLTFSYVTATGILSWAYTYGAVCQYKRYVVGVLTALNDSPQYLFYINGGISNRSAPTTFAPIITNAAAGTVGIPITTTGYTGIGAMTLYLEYDPAVITYLGTFTKNVAFNSSFQVGDIAGSGTKRLIVIQWYGNAVTLSSGGNATIVTLNFNYPIAGVPSALKWYDNGPSCEYADGSGNVLIDMPSTNYYINGSIGMTLINIALRKTTNCGEFTVNLKPITTIVANLTKVTFTVKWAAIAGSDVQLENILATYLGLQQIGSRVLYGGYYYVTFSSTSSYAVNWLANTEHTILTFRHSGNGDGNTNFTIIPVDYNTIPPGLNTAYSVEEISINVTDSIINNANNVSLNCGICLKDYLQGTYDTIAHQMRTTLADQHLVPMSQPYNVSPWMYSGTEQIPSYPSGMVDWVLVELRTGTSASTVVSRRAAILHNDGSITDTNGTAPVLFHTFTPGNNYYVVVYHRNHLPVMTANAIMLPNTAATKHDFTINPATNVYSTTNEGVMLLEPGSYGQIAGDINTDNKLRYTGANNDRDFIISRITTVNFPSTSYLNSIIQGYYNEDLTMDGIVKYSGPNNDQAIIIANIDLLTNPTTLSSEYQGQVPVSYAAKSMGSSSGEGNQGNANSPLNNTSPTNSEKAK